ncbi:MAG: type II/IV secretion system ATPase subunit [Desulfurococcaceae archaeon]|nr:type II/IV secretion system ATPase subunit [Desulfurococcaceae archaeon]
MSSKRSASLSFLSRLRRGKEKAGKPEAVAAPSMSFVEATRVLSHELLSAKKGYRIIETYPVVEPFASINIVEDEATGKLFYEVYEISLTNEEREIYEQIYEHMMWEIKPIATLSGDAIEEIRGTARRIMNLFQIRFPRTPSLSWSKINYYIERDFLGYGILDPVFRDRYIEDISCNGPGKPIYVWHRKYESLPTNVVFKTEEELDAYVLKLAHMAGKHISVAYPVLDAILPGGHRVAATYSKEVSTSGSSFTIRKFSESPITIADMISFGTISSELASYFWLAMDYKMTALILGVTGAGKTSTLNALATLLRPTYKVVTIEDTPELRLPLENWVQLVSRPSYLGGAGEVSLYQLVRVSLRYRPDVIIVGEVRGDEAYVLFQSIATGHSGMTTLHAESIDAAVKRLTSPPMNIPPSYIPLVNVALLIRRVTLVDEKGRLRPARKITNVWEIRDFGEYEEVARWDPAKNRFNVRLDNSLVLSKVTELTGKTKEELLEELVRRKMLLEWLVATRRTAYKDVATWVQKYYLDPVRTLREGPLYGSAPK